MKTKYFYYAALGLLTLNIATGIKNGFTPLTATCSIVTAVLLGESTRRGAYKA